MPEANNVARLLIVDRNGDGRNEIAAWTARGHIFYLGFDGSLQGRASSVGVAGEAEIRWIR